MSGHPWTTPTRGLARKRKSSPTLKKTTSQPACERTSAMSIFALMLQDSPSCSNSARGQQDDDNNNNNNDNDNNNTDSGFSLPADSPSMTLVDRQRVKCEAVTRFLKFFDRTLDARRTSSNPKYPVDSMPNKLEFHFLFRQMMDSDTCSFMQMSRLSSVADETLKKAAASAVHFFSFMNKRSLEAGGGSGSVQCADEEGADERDDDRCELAIEEVRKMTATQKASLIGEFYTWYERVAPVRVSSSKMAACQGVAARVYVKESSTMMTVIRGLLAFWTYMGLIEASSDRAPTEESKTIWRVVRTCVKLTEKMKGGRLDLSKRSLSFTDAVRLMKRSEGVESMFALQSWLLALVLAGLGVRVGSLRNQFPRVHVSSTRQRSISDDEEEEEDDEEEEDGDGRRNDGDDRDTDLCFAFDILHGKDVRVWRRSRRVGDPIGAVRLRTAFTIKHSKMSGTEVFAPKVIGGAYPQVASNGSEDWSLNVAVVIALLTSFVGTTTIEQFVSDDYEPTGERGEIELTTSSANALNSPLFRAANARQNLLPGPMRNVKNALELVADSLRIPSSLFSSKSYRSGYARDVVQGIVSRGDPQTLITLDSIRQNLLSGTQWKSAQVDRYLQNLSRSLALNPVTNTGTALFDWRSAVYNDLASSKVEYQHVTPATLHSYMQTNHVNFSLSTSQLEAMGSAENLKLCNILNTHNWRQCVSQPRTPEEQLEFLLCNPSVNVKDTFKQLGKFMRAKVRPFCGMGWWEKEGHFKCPVLNCKSPLHPSLDAAEEHWKEWHEECKREVTYLCLKCETTQKSSYRSYMNHLNCRHRLRSSRFNFVFTES